MRRSLIPLLSLLATATGCWLGTPYDPIYFCWESDIDPMTETARTVFHTTSHLITDSWNDEAQDPVGECGTADNDLDLPEWIFELRDDDGNETRFGWTLPELERPIDEDEDDLVTLLVVEQEEPDTFGAVLYQGECPYPPTPDCTVEMVLDDGLGGRVIDDDLITPFTVERGEKVAQRNGDCGKAEYHQIEVRGGDERKAINPGNFDQFMADEDGDQVIYFATNVNNYTWVTDECGDAPEMFSYVLMRGE